LFKTAKKTPVCIFTAVAKPKITQKGVEIVKVGLRRACLDKLGGAQSSRKYKGRINLQAALAELGKRNIQQLLVEGGEKVITSFLKQKLADEVTIYTSAEKLAKKGKIKSSQIMRNLYNRLKKNYKNQKRFGKDIRSTAFLK
jgi:riboflavin biosynthesis pyrimidine reductase